MSVYADIVNTLTEYLKDGMVIGLGSGRTVGMVLDLLAGNGKVNIKSLRFIPSSLQIRLKAEALALNIVDESLIPCVDLVLDGADQIDSRLNMIKGGGGALLREKVLIHAAEKVIILADKSKYADRLTLPIPIEVLPYARAYVAKVLKDEFNAEPRIRVNERGYPVVTENGNIILDTLIDTNRYYDGKGGLAELEHEIRCIAGVIEVGLFTRHADVYYKIKDDGIEVIKPS